MNRRFVLVGPPDAGKTTWVARRKSEGDLVWDFDNVAGALTFDRDRVHHRPLPPSIVDVVHALRDALVEWLQNYVYTSGDVYIIVTHRGAAEKIAARVGADIIDVPPIG